MKKLSFIAALGFGTVFTAPVWALDCQRADCTALGYTDKETDTTCTKFVRCPFDSKAVLCIQHKTEAACDVGYKKTVAECGTVAFGSYKLGAAQASNAACKKCEITCNTNYTLSNGVCSKPKTCDDLLRELNCKRYNNGASISGNLANLKICLFGTVTQASGYNSSLTLDNTTVYDAGKQFPECEAEMTGRAKLVTKGSVTMKGNSRFFCDVSMDSVPIPFRPNGGTWSADFYGNTDIGVQFSANTAWYRSLSMNFYGEEEKTTNKVFVGCEQTSSSSWSDVYCEVDINAYNADVSYWGTSTSSGGCDTDDSYSGIRCVGEPKIECYENDDATCKEDENLADQFYWW